MSRDDDFSDIPALGPADEDRLQKSIPTLETPHSVNQPKQSPPASSVVAKNRSHPLLWVLIVLLAAAVGFSIYQQMQLQQQLRFSEDALLQTQSRLADLESLVNATDESSSKTGAAFLAQLKRQQSERSDRIAHVDGEIRKLWAIYQKYKPVIEGLEKDVAAQQQRVEANGQQLVSQDKELAGQQKELKTVGESLDTVGVTLNQQREAVAKLTKSAEQTNTALTKQLQTLEENLRFQNLDQQETNDLQQAEIAELKAKLNQSSATQQLAAKLDEHQKALDSINANRRQVNAELLKIRNQLGRLQASTGS